MNVLRIDPAPGGYRQGPTHLVLDWVTAITVEWSLHGGIYYWVVFAHLLMRDTPLAVREYYGGSAMPSDYATNVVAGAAGCEAAEAFAAELSEKLRAVAPPLVLFDRVEA